VVIFRRSIMTRSDVVSFFLVLLERQQDKESDLPLHLSVAVRNLTW
jgi:hypothetical protein